MKWQSGWNPQSYEAELRGGKQAERPRWFTDSRTGCRVRNDFSDIKAIVSWSGDCADGKAQGTGILTVSADGQSKGGYSGGMIEGVRDGRGAFTFPNGNRYDGQWQNGQRNGHGVLTWANGNRYDGEWRDNKRNGHGLLVTTSLAVAAL